MVDSETKESVRLMSTARREGRHVIDASTKFVKKQGFVASPVDVPQGDRDTWEMRVDGLGQKLECQREDRRPSAPMTQPAIPKEDLDLNGPGDGSPLPLQHPIASVDSNAAKKLGARLYYKPS